MIGLCDCNNFFVSCERVFRPDLNGKPVVVLSNNDGCIISRSNESKALGVKMGAPLYQIRPLIEKEKITVFSSNYQLYGDMSNRVMLLLKEMAPSVEIYSIDEAFLDFSGFDNESLQQKGREIVRAVRRNTGIPVSLGIAPTKTLAKIASKLCKQYPRLEGCCVMSRPEDIEKVLRKFPIEDVWGIGRRFASMLTSGGIKTAFDFSRLPKEWVKSRMSIVGVRTLNELNSIPCIEFEHAASDKKSVCVSRSFAKDIYSKEDLRTSLSAFTTLVAEKLRNQKSCAARMNVFIVTNRHREELPQSYENALIRFETATDSTLEITSKAISALNSLVKQGYGYKRAGVIMSDIYPKNGICGTLFDTIDRPKHTKLMPVIDDINSQNGRNFIGVAWRGFRALLTNRYYVSQ